MWSDLSYHVKKNNYIASRPAVSLLRCTMHEQWPAISTMGRFLWVRFCIIWRRQKHKTKMAACDLYPRNIWE